MARGSTLDTKIFGVESLLSLVEGLLRLKLEGGLGMIESMLPILFIGIRVTIAAFPVLLTIDAPLRSIAEAISTLLTPSPFAT